jgi:hypothetical protein
VIKFVSNLQQVSGFLSVLRFPPTIKLTGLDENFHAVVGDFGLSRDIYAKDYYASENKKTKLPVKWMAPECLDCALYSSSTTIPEE